MSRDNYGSGSKQFQNHYALGGKQVIGSCPDESLTVFPLFPQTVILSLALSGALKSR